jgi:hypothetical protein
VLLVDDLEGSAVMQPRNLIRVTARQGTNADDNVLLAELFPALLEIASQSDLPHSIACLMQNNRYGCLSLSRKGHRHRLSSMQNAIKRDCQERECDNQPIALEHSD